MPGNSEVRAIAPTAYGRDRDRRQALEAGYDMHVSKPVGPKKLLNAVHMLLRHKKGSR